MNLAFDAIWFDFTPIPTCPRSNYGNSIALLTVCLQPSGSYLNSALIAHDGNAGSAFPIVVIGHEATDPGMNAEGAEEIAGDVFAVAGIDGRLRTDAADTERLVAGLQSGQICELGRVGTEIFVGFPGEERKVAVFVLCVAAPIAAAVLVTNAPEFLGPGDWQISATTAVSS